uniref:Uncharacterized protein n=1 Tax=Seriola dumerili TaxID=41447 RepID=A0A3B4UYJ7_SERDU
MFLRQSPTASPGILFVRQAEISNNQNFCMNLLQNLMSPTTQTYPNTCSTAFNKRKTQTQLLIFSNYAVH